MGASEEMNHSFTENLGRDAADQRRLLRRKCDDGKYLLPGVDACCDPGVKSEARVTEKATMKYEGRLERTRDIARLAIICNNATRALQAVQELRLKFSICQLEN